MGIFTEEIQKTSVTLYIEKLSNYEEIEWYQFQQLIESMNMQESGPREAIEAIRKRLKHGTQEQKLRTLEILKLLMENSPQHFRQKLCASDKMRERFEFMLSSPMETTEVKKRLVSLLGAWSTKYKGEPGIRLLTNIYESGLSKLGLSRRSRSGSSASPPSQEQQQQNQQQVSEPPKRRSMPPPMKPVRPEPTNVAKTKPRSHSNAATASGTHQQQRQGSTSAFDFATAKPKIIQEIALANQHVNQLTNALKLLNTTEDRWEIDLQHDKRLQEYRQECENSKKKIVKYARLVEDEEWIGTLLTTNEELLKALDMYDIMSVGEVPANLYGNSSPTSPTATAGNQYQQQSLLPAPATTQQIAYHNDDDNNNTLEQDLHGLQLVPRHSPLEAGDDDDDDPFADPFADPVETPPPTSSTLNHHQRQNEYVL
ncbi:hypothetical protein BCR42DRAFT_421445 [Absidia repens]|uniref:VHS domain-containing protein n=1 Tax=Absidia repens TaxID=90262 RepID=A0A1X2I7E2_9FUNG|nr:hypothetical protein BCR42DRAFT_421445 [Absidia repens]